MKKLLKPLFVLVLIGCWIAADANIWTVSNNASRPAQYTNIQDAIDTASNGDTILITAGTYSRSGGFNIRKELVFIGEGISSPTTIIDGTCNGCFAVDIERFTPSVSASGSKFISIRFDGIVNIDGNYSGGNGTGLETITDLLFERCYFVASSLGYVSYVSADGGYSNHVFRNSVWIGSNGQLGFNINDAQLTNILLTNNIINDSDVDGNNHNLNGGLIIRNNLFLATSPSCSFDQMNNILVENNIFYRAEVCGISNSTFNNNLTFLNNTPAFPIGSSGNVGSGNFVDLDPEFTSYPAPPAVVDWSLSHDYTPQSALVDTSGTNGTAIGLTGGSAPMPKVKKHPKIPVVTEVNIPVSSVPVGGTLQINLKANTRD